MPHLRTVPVVSVLTALLIGGLSAGASSGSATEAPRLPSRPAGSHLRAGAPGRPHPSATVPQLRRDGRWLVDPQGRVVIVHGLNLVYKRKPYVPPDSPAGFTRRDVSWLARHGFNAARVGTLWAGLTPTAPGQADPAYLDQWQRVLDLLARKRIWIQLDMHQDQWHEEYGGEGVPDWAAVRQPPFNLTPPLVAPFPTGYWTPEVSSMFDDFWADRRGLLDGWLAAWRVAATRWQHQRYLMGYDLLNEPWMGLEWPTCLADGCPASYPSELQPAMEAGLRTVRAIDRDNIVWWEPQQFAGGQAVDTFFTAPPAGEQQLGLLVAQLLPGVFLESTGRPRTGRENCRAYSDGREQHALVQSERMHAVPMMSEWGATDNLARDQDRRGLCGPAPDGLDALGLQVLGRPDHRRR